MKILWVSDSPTVNTGFGIVAYNLLDRLVKMGHDVTVLGINHYGNPYDQNKYPYFIYPCDHGSSDKIFGVQKLWHLIKELEPDVLFMLNDPWIIDRQMEAKFVEAPYMKTIAYYPIDGGPLKKKWAKRLNELDAQVCYSDFGRKIVTEANEGVTPKNLHQLYHGVDRKTFFPVNQSIARKELGLPQDAFIVGMVARNQYRKRFDILMSAFAKFAKDKPDAKLYLHTALEDIGFDITDLSEQFDLGNKLILTEGVTAAHGVTDGALNLIYNSFDVNCLISLGDGFGLPVAESMATGVAQLVSDHSCLKELVDGHGGLTVKSIGRMLNIAGINTWGEIPSEDDLVLKLNILYENRDLRIKLAEEGYKHIVQPQFDWDVIAKSFENIIYDLFHIIRKKEGDLIGATALN